MKNQSNGDSPLVRCRLCKRELVQAPNGWVHHPLQARATSVHLADPLPRDMRVFHIWQRSRLSS